VQKKIQTQLNLIINTTANIVEIVRQFVENSTLANIVDNIGCGIYDQDIYLLPSISFATVKLVYN